MASSASANKSDSCCPIYDCSFSVKEKLIPANKSLLAYHSDVFERMFYSPLAERNFPINVEDVEPEVFQGMLKFVYTQVVNIRSIQEAFDLLYVAWKYMVSGLELKALEYIVQNMELEDIFAIFEPAKLLESKDLINRCCELFQERTWEALQIVEFKNASLDTLADLFALDDLNIKNETELIEAFNQYVKDNGLIRTEKSPNPSMEKVIRHLRFNSIKSYILCGLLQSIDWLLPYEKYVIVQNSVIVSYPVFSDNVPRVPQIKLDVLYQGNKRYRFSNLLLEVGKRIGNGRLFNYVDCECKKRPYHRWDTIIWSCLYASQGAEYEALNQVLVEEGCEASVISIMNSMNRRLMRALENYIKNTDTFVLFFLQ